MRVTLSRTVSADSLLSRRNGHAEWECLNVLHRISGEEKGAEDDMQGEGQMTMEIDNANTRRDETEKSNGMQRKQESVLQ